MKLEEGMYVRTREKIVKIEKILDGVMWDTQGYLHFGDFIKASYNIIDLIEVGDYVNGYKVLKVDINKEKNTWTIILDNEIPRFLIADDIKSVNPIKSIVTKEQFESMSYKVGEK